MTIFLPYMKILSTLFLSLTITLCVAQENSHHSKIRKMMDLAGTSAQYDLVLKQYLDQERETNEQLDDVYWDRMETVLFDTIKTQLIGAIVPVYAKYLTESDLDEVIDFYESEAGKTLVMSQPKIMQESMEIGKELGGIMGKEVFDFIQQELNDRFDKSYTGCEFAKTGNFHSTNNNLRVTYERNEEQANGT